MRKQSIISLSLIVWTLLLGQATSLVSLAEALHAAGHHSHVSSASAEQHQDGECQSQSLLNHCAVALLVKPLVTQLNSHAMALDLKPFIAFYYFLSEQQTIRAPPTIPSKSLNP